MFSLTWANLKTFIVRVEVGIVVDKEGKFECGECVLHFEVIKMFVSNARENTIKPTNYLARDFILIIRLFPSAGT